MNSEQDIAGTWKDSILQINLRVYREGLEQRRSFGLSARVSTKLERLTYHVTIRFERGAKAEYARN